MNKVTVLNERQNLLTLEIIDKSRGVICNLNKEPFYNCQICTIGAFANILDYNLEDQKDSLAEIYKYINKTELLIDIKRGYESKVTSLFNPDEIIFKQQYINNTGSEMTMYLLQFRRMLERYTTEKANSTKVADKVKF